MRPGSKPLFDRSPRADCLWADAASDLSADIAFLRAFRSTSPSVLNRAEAAARREGTAAHACLIANRGISEQLYYQALAAHLGIRFVEDSMNLAVSLEPVQAMRRGYARLAPEAPAKWLLAPTGIGVLSLLARRALRCPMRDVLITTPTRFSALVLRTKGPSIADQASNALPRRDPTLSAKNAVNTNLGWALAFAMVALLGCSIIAPDLITALTGFAFFMVITFRLLVCANGLASRISEPEPLTDAQLPFYSILVPLKGEAGIVTDLIANLDLIDYPRSKLDVKIVVEDDDSATKFACFAARLAPHYDVVVAPRGEPKTKPRALNIALPLLKGDFVTVYDAEDAPEPDQLRKAAARFHHTPRLGCLQARLTVDGRDRLLTWLFGIDYAVLFGLYNPGLANANLPMALGGTSNHFRKSVLVRIGGWDAWNVAEDADLGLRLARFGYRSEMLNSTTFEVAPSNCSTWFRQRRRWTKGWMQTAIVLGRRPGRLLKELGPAKTVFVALILTALVIGPLASLPLTALAIGRLLAFGIPHPHGCLEIINASLWTWVFIAGPLSTLWAGHVGARAIGIEAPPHILVCLLPYQALISLAAWCGLVDLCRNPYHWHKTHHGSTASAFGVLNRKRTGRSRHPSAKGSYGNQPLRAFRAAYLASR